MLEIGAVSRRLSGNITRSRFLSQRCVRISVSISASRGVVLTQVHILGVWLASTSSGKGRSKRSTEDNEDEDEDEEQIDVQRNEQQGDEMTESDVCHSLSVVFD